MKKIFTLVAAVAMAAGVQAQTVETEVLNVASDEIQGKIAAAIENPIELANTNFFVVSQDKIYPAGTNDAGAVAVVPSDGTPISLKTYIWEHSTGKASIKAVSTPNADAKPEEAWQKKGNGGNEALNVEGCSPIFMYGTNPKNGNPTASYKDYYEYNLDDEPVHRVFDGPYWEPGCGWLPAKGCYYELNVTEAGKMKVALWVNKNLNSNPLYILDKDANLIDNTKIDVIGFMQNNTFEKNEADEPCGTKPYILNAEYKLVPAATPDATPANRPFFGYFTFDVEAGGKYTILSPKSQPGIFGYEFTPDGTSGINEIAVAANSSVAYNIAGQRVAPSVKGLVIVNGKKIMNK